MRCPECGKEYQGDFCSECHFKCNQCSKVLDRVIYQSIDSMETCYECYDEFLDGQPDQKLAVNS